MNWALNFIAWRTGIRGQLALSLIIKKYSLRKMNLTNNFLRKMWTRKRNSLNGGRRYPKLLLGRTLPHRVSFKVPMVPGLASDQRAWPYYESPDCVWWGLPSCDVLLWVCNTQVLTQGRTTRKLTCKAIFQDKAELQPSQNSLGCPSNLQMENRKEVLPPHPGLSESAPDERKNGKMNADTSDEERSTGWPQVPFILGFLQATACHFEGLLVKPNTGSA